MSNKYFYIGIVCGSFVGTLSARIVLNKIFPHVKKPQVIEPQVVATPQVTVTPVQKISNEAAKAIEDFTHALKVHEVDAYDDGSVTATYFLQDGDAPEVQEAKVKYAASLGWKESRRSELFGWIVLTKKVREKSGIVEGFEAATKDNSRKRP